MNISLCVDSRFFVVVKECDLIYNLGKKISLGFIDIWPFFSVLEYKSFKIDSLSIEVNLLLKYDNYATKIFKLLSVI